MFRAAQMPAGAACPHHRHHWGEVVYASSGVMEVQLATEHDLIPPQHGLLEHLRQTPPAQAHGAPHERLLQVVPDQMGMTLTEWRRRLRTVKVMALREAGRKVEHIAHDLGHASTSTFIGMFRRLTGTTPDGYRKGR